MEILNVTANEIQPFDGLTEGSVVRHVTRHEAEQRDPVTGVVTRRPVVTVVLGLAQIEREDYDGGHLHRLSSELVDERTFDPGDTVRLVRPAPLAPCSCGYRGVS